jgi:hypothetical protein
MLSFQAFVQTRETRVGSRSLIKEFKVQQSEENWIGPRQWDSSAVVERVKFLECI